MKQFLLALLFLSGSVTTIFAADGYTVKMKFTDYKDKKVFLAHYYGKPLPTIYKVDSAVVDKNGKVTLESKEEIIGGLYLIVLDGHTNYFEFLLDNGQQIDMTVTSENLPLGVEFKNSPENTRFFKYMLFLKEVGDKHQALSGQMESASTAADSAALQQKIAGLASQVSDFRLNYIKQNPKTLLSNIFNALEMPSVPMVNKPDGTPDNEEWFRRYKSQYWSNVDFSDERLVYTPLLDNRLEIYFGKLVQANPDSFSADADMVIGKAAASKEVFKYVVHWLTNYVQESDIMGMDAVFVHIVENCHMKGEAFWLNQGSLEKYIERARSIAPNVIGNIGPELKMKTMDGEDISLSGVKAKYTVLIFWSPDCGHCREEIPRIDSAIKAQGLDKKGLKVVAFNIDKETAKWNEIIKENKLESWVNVHDPERTSNFRAQYDVYGTPSIYLLDEKKIIRGKKLDHTNIGMVVEMLEDKATSKN